MAESSPASGHETPSPADASQSEVQQLRARNDRLAAALRETREQVDQLRDEVAKMSAPPGGYGVLLDHNPDGTVDIVSNGRKVRVNVSAEVAPETLTRGAEVLLNESLHVVFARSSETVGDMATVVEVLEDGIRAMVRTRGDDTRVAQLADALRGTLIRPGDVLRLDPRSQLLLERLPQPEVEDLLLEEVPNVSYADIGGLDTQITQIADAVELPYLYPDLFAEYQLPAPKGILLYGPPGCGKTLIAKAVANSLAKKVAERTGFDKGRSYFINIKGPELLNKYVGETERHIRLVFQRAREKSEEGWPVIVFFDEMDSMFRTRGSGVSSDMESTIVPQLLAELDGVEQMSNVIVIGATNREDLIDPAILRPGRLDVKIKVDRPNSTAAAQVFARYVTDDIPLSDDTVGSHASVGDAIASMIQETVGYIFDKSVHNRFLEVTYQNGDKEMLYFSDFLSGAMIENIVRRAKKDAIKRQIAGTSRGLTTADLIEAFQQEFRENEDLPNTTNPDDWARISGRKGERIVFIRTLMNKGDSSSPQGGKAIEHTVSGQYL